MHKVLPAQSGGVSSRVAELAHNSQEEMPPVTSTT